MKKNLLVFHLESISNTILWQYRAELEVIWALMQASRCYTLFNTTATSTDMAVGAFFRGNVEVNDYVPHFRMPFDHPKELLVTIWRYLYLGGFYPKVIVFDSIFHKQVDKDTYVTVPNHEELFKTVSASLDKAAALKRPFAMYVADQTSHMAADTDYKATAPSFSERFRRAYRSIDATVRHVLAMIGERKLLEDTIVVLYGDHGDELWCHDLNRGFCHGTPPYASQTWTPLFICENAVPPSSSARLVSMVDLRGMLLKRLLPGFVPPKAQPFYTSPFTGMDPDEKARELAFSQNLYSLQMEYDDPEKALTKGYAVTDGVYRVVVTSGGNRTRDGGMEFFYDRLDPFNSRNLLEFFSLDADGEPVKFNPPPEAVSPEFSLTFNAGAVRGLMDKYSYLRRKLREYIRAKEALAMTRKKGEEYHVMPERVFNFSRKRLRRS